MQAQYGSALDRLRADMARQELRIALTIPVPRVWRLLSPASSSACAEICPGDPG